MYSNARAVCAIASRFYRERPELYSIAMHFAKASAASTLVEGHKSVELCQAYLLLAIWSSGNTRTFDEDRGWLWLGYAIRYARPWENDNTISLSEDQHGNGIESSPPANAFPTHGDPRTRGAQPHSYLGESSPVSWTTRADHLKIHCFNQDRCTAAQLGKPITIHEEPSLLPHMEFLKRSKYALPYDIYGNAFTALLRIVSGFREVFAHTQSEDSLGSSVDIRALAFQTDTEILQCQHEALVGFKSFGGARVQSP